MLIPETMKNKINKVFYDKTVDVMDTVVKIDAEGGIKYTIGNSGADIDNLTDVKLPSNYNRLDYLIVNNASVLLNHSATLNTSVEIEFELTELNNITVSLFCCRISASSNALYIYLTSGGHLCFAYGNVRTYGIIQLLVNTRYVIRTDKNKLYLNDDLLLTVTGDNLSINNTTGSLLFANYNTQNNIMREFNGYITNLKCYNFKIWNDNTLVNNCMPCIKDNLIGFYDIITKQFIEQYNGIGSFVQGNIMYPVLESFKANVNFANCGKIQEEYGLDYLINIAITTNTDVNVNINDIIRYNALEIFI